jgi:signal transduction histidine kinase
MSRVEAEVQVDAHVIRQLGDQLITDAEQALLELIKNSYDADATWVHVTVSTGDDDSEGVITVEDNGSGMDLALLQTGWLTVSLSPKREMKAKGRRTKLGRTPLGDKGLGRLATMKLGTKLEITTHAAPGQPGNRLVIDWNAFTPGRRLKEIKIPIDSVPPAKRTGTVVRVTNLADPSYWSGQDRIRNLETELSLLVTPFSEIADFKLSATVEGTRLNLAKLTHELRDSATARFTLEWDDDILRCVGDVKLNLFKSKADDGFEELIADDNGAAFFKHLKAQGLADSLGLKRHRQGNWYLRVEDTFTWADIKKSAAYPELIAKPGPLKAELDAFDLDVEAGLGIFSSSRDYRAFVKEHAGVRVYRNGFSIRMPEDWLGLGKAITSGKSYYSLKPATTLGYVAISSADNKGLQEKSDRESFLDTPESRGFAAAMGRFVLFCNNALTHLRRGAAGFRGDAHSKAAGLSTQWTPKNAVSKLTDVARQSRDRKRKLKELDKQREQAAKRLTGGLQTLVESSTLPPRARSDAGKLLAEAKSLLSEYTEKRAELDDVIAAVEDEGTIARAVSERFELMERQIDEVYETVALGLAARAFAHDVNALLDDLLARTTKVSRQLNAKSAGPIVAGYIESVRATVATLRRQLNFIEPMLRRARENRQQIKLVEFMSELFELRSERMKRLGITVEMVPTQDFSVSMSKGRLLQVFDNLARNSEYWLSRDDARSKKIRVEIAQPRVLFSDSGPGVRPAIEGQLFEMFVSDKPRGEASGLGLFIVRELLQREGCTVVLLPERNNAGRRYRFAVDLSAVNQ